jgi:hypothetical protein
MYIHTYMLPIDHCDIWMMYLLYVSLLQHVNSMARRSDVQRVGRELWGLGDNPNPDPDPNGMIVDDRMWTLT